MLKVALQHRIVVGAAGLALLGLASAPSLAEPTTPKPAERCSQHAEGSSAWKKCMGRKFKDDEEAYSVGYWRAKTGDYAGALEALRSATYQADPRIQTMIGFSLRKLGMIDEAMAYYAAALTADSSLTSTRQYLGEAFLQKGQRSKALDQLAEIGRLCGGSSCAHYKLLAEAIAMAG